MKFEGMECVLESITHTLIRQLDDDECLCAACYIGYKTLYKSVGKEKHLTGQMKAMNKRIESYWSRINRKR